MSDEIDPPPPPKVLTPAAQRALEIHLDADVLARLDEIFPGYKTAPEHYAW